MKEIHLTNSERLALVSDEDFEYLAQFNWYLTKNGYASKTSETYTCTGKKRKSVLMHRIVLERVFGDIPVGFETDHEDRDKLNNTRENLRLCTKAQNMANIGYESYQGSSKYKGVTRRGQRWLAQIRVNGEHKDLGRFNSEIAAAAAYNKAAREGFGNFAVLNDVPDDVEDAAPAPRFNSRRGAYGYKGIAKHGKKWRGLLVVKGIIYRLGSFITPEAAARAWDRKAFELYGDAAPLNFPDEIKDTL